MLEVLIHWYAHVEVYAFVLAWIVIPLGFWSLYIMFRSTEKEVIPDAKD